MQIKWDDMRLFLAVHETGSLSGAARKLRLGQPTLSRRIAEMEQLIGEPLFQRQSHGVTLTAIGHRLIPSAQRMAEWAAEATHSLAINESSPAGRIRIAAPPSVTSDFLAPFAHDFHERFPQIQIDVLSDFEVLSLARGEADISLRGLPPDDPDLCCIDQISRPFRVFVGRDYAATIHPDCRLQDLRLISWAPPFDHHPTCQMLKTMIPDFSPAFTSDDYNVQYTACELGVGAMLQPKFLHRYGRNAKLIELDIDLGPDAVKTLYLVCHRRQRHLPKVQAVTDAIMKEFEYARKSMTTCST